MCDDRQRLIGYVYDECDTHERQEIEQHLETCHTCRREITGLRNVRQDLLAWDVPATSSVWQPFAPQRAKVTWRDVPSWILAAAASLVFFAGAAGGVATHALLPHPTIVAAAPAPSALIAATSPSGREGFANASVQVSPVSAQELRDLEARFAVMEQRLRQVSGRSSDPRVINAELQRRIDELQSWQFEQMRTNLEVSNSVSGLQQRWKNLERANMRPISSDGSSGAGPGGK